MNSRYYNQSIPKYIKGEPIEHIKAKCKVAVIGLCYGYQNDQEVKTKTSEGYRVDIILWNLKNISDCVAVNIDGGYHFSNYRQTKKTQNRDLVLIEYFKGLGIRYVTLTVEDINDTMTVDEIKQKLGLKGKK